MCTWIIHHANLMGSGKGTTGWFPIEQANVAYDHPADAPLDHAVLIDFVNADMGPAARVAVELSAQSARGLVQAILNALDDGEKQHAITDQPTPLLVHSSFVD